MVDRGGRMATIYQTGTYSRVSTETHPFFTRGSVNTNPYFQPMILSLSDLAGQALMLDQSKYSQKTYHAHVIGDEIQEIDESMMTCPYDNWKPLIQSKPDSDFCFFKKERVEVKSRATKNDFPDMLIDTSKMTMEGKILADKLKSYQLGLDCTRHINRVSREAGQYMTNIRHVQKCSYNWFFKINHDVVAQNIAIFFLARELMDNINNESLSRGTEYIRLSVSRSLEDLHWSSMEPLEAWVLIQDFIDMTQGTKYGNTNHGGNIWDPHVAQKYLSNLFKSIWVKVQDGGFTIDMFDSAVVFPQMNPNLHPIIINLAILAYNSDTDTDFLIYCRAMKEIRDTISNLIKEGNNIGIDIQKAIKCREFSHCSRMSYTTIRILDCICKQLRIYKSCVDTGSICKLFESKFDIEKYRFNPSYEIDMPNLDCTIIRYDLSERNKKMVYLSTDLSKTSHERNTIENKAKSTRNQSYTLPTRTANKLFSMINIIGSELKSYQNMMDVGSGRGSCAKALMMLNSKTKLFVFDNFHSFNAI
jgi:hypothetical protein